MRNLFSSKTSPHKLEKKRQFILWVAALVLIAFLAGCATMGHDFPADQVTDIKIGSTRQYDIRAMFGEPWRVGIEDGQTTWTYGRYRYNLFTQNTAKDLVIHFNDRGVVTSYAYNTTEANK